MGELIRWGGIREFGENVVSMLCLNFVLSKSDTKMMQNNDPSNDAFLNLTKKGYIKTIFYS